MAADHDDLDGLLASANLADDVRRLDVALDVRFHLQAHDDAGAAIGDPLQTIRVLGGDGCRWNLRHVAGVLKRPSVRRA